MTVWAPTALTQPDHNDGLQATGCSAIRDVFDGCLVVTRDKRAQLLAGDLSVGRRSMGDRLTGGLASEGSVPYYRR
jgi:hypothetical protein